MEIKIQCPCGTKYKFDVEPVHGRMPAPVNCPSCGADGTAQANEFLRQSTTASTLIASAPIPVAMPVPRAAFAGAPPVPVTAVPTPPPVPIAPVPACFSGPGSGAIPAAPPIGHRAAPGTFSTAPRIPPPQAIAPAAIPQRTPSTPTAKRKGALTTIAIIVLVVICFGFGVWRVGSKWAKRFKEVADIASAISEASKQAAKGEPKNLDYDDLVILFIKHTNHTDVANACKTYWKEKLNKNLTITESLDTAEQPGEYSVLAAHNGFVRPMSTRDWEPNQFEAVAMELSGKLNTLVFEMTSEHVADTYHFGAYEQGVRKFHAQMEVKITKDTADEIVTTDGNDWAIANGYKPGPDGFNSFDLADADKITQRLGMKFWDEKEDSPGTKGLLLTEAATARQKPTR